LKTRKDIILWIVNAYQKIGESHADQKFRFDFVKDLWGYSIPGSGKIHNFHHTRKTEIRQAERINFLAL
jgi:hypothetical protein